MYINLYAHGHTSSNTHISNVPGSATAASRLAMGVRVHVQDVVTSILYSCDIFRRYDSIHKNDARCIEDHFRVHAGKPKGFVGYSVRSRKYVCVPGPCSFPRFHFNDCMFSCLQTMCVGPTLYSITHIRKQPQQHTLLHTTAREATLASSMPHVNFCGWHFRNRHRCRILQRCMGVRFNEREKWMRLLNPTHKLNYLGCSSTDTPAEALA